MTTKYHVVKGRYIDSVLLMQVTRDIEKMDGVSKAGAMSGTEANLAILINLGFRPPAVDNNSIVVAVEASDEQKADEAIKASLELMDKKRESAAVETLRLDGLRSAIRGGEFPLLFIATPGEFVEDIAVKGLEAGANLHIFSSNVPLEVEKRLKEDGRDRGLLVLGPDSGTTIIQGKGIGFANAVNKGSTGVIASSGTGLQEFTVMLHEGGLGVSAALGVGSKDLSKGVGGIMTREGLRFVDGSRMFAIISKNPDPSVMEEMVRLIKGKPSVFVQLGSDVSRREGETLITGRIDEGVNYLLERAKRPLLRFDLPPVDRDLGDRRLLRGYFAGGSLCYQAQAVLGRSGLKVYSNEPADPKLALPENWDNIDVAIDTGSEEYVQGRPHPMIDPELRNSFVVKDSARPDVRVILMDVILGYGSSMDPLAGLDKMSDGPLVVASVTGTAEDVQDRSKIVGGLDDLGVVHFTSGSQAARYAAAAMGGRP